MKYLFLVNCFICYTTICVAQTIVWQKTIGGSGVDQLITVIHSHDKGVFLCGYSNSNASGDKTENSYGSYDYWVIKLDSLQNIEWQKTIGGNKIDYLQSAFNTSDNGIILGGYSNSDISGLKNENSFLGSDDYWVVKLSANGEIEWQNTLGGNNSDWMYSIIQTSDGGYLACGGEQSFISGDIVEDGPNGENYWLVKLSATGTIEWQKTYGGTNIEEATSIEQTADGGYIVCGTSWSDISGVKTENSYGESDIWILKLDALGEIEWDKTIGGNSSEDEPRICRTSDNGFIVGCGSASGISGLKTESCSGSDDYWIMKIDLNGELVWQKTIGGTTLDYFTTLKINTKNEVIVGGWSLSDISGEKTVNHLGKGDLWVVKLNADNGEILNQTVYGGDQYDAIWSMDIDETGYLLAGSSASGISGNKTEPSRGSVDYWVLKIQDDPIDFDQDGFTSDLDCDDHNANVNPNQIEILNNGLDDDCNPETSDIDIDLVNKTFISGTDSCLGSMGTITVSGENLSVKFESGSSITLIAGQSIRFLPGFHAQNGSFVDAHITTDGSFCDQVLASNSILSNSSELKSLETLVPEKPFEATIDEKLVKVYPNPNNGRFTVELTNFENPVEISVINMLGKSIYASTLTNTNQFGVDLIKQPKGIYLVLINDGIGLTSKKILVE